MLLRPFNLGRLGRASLSRSRNGWLLGGVIHALSAGKNRSYSLGRSGRLSEQLHLSVVRAQKAWEVSKESGLIVEFAADRPRIVDGSLVARAAATSMTTNPDDPRQWFNNGSVVADLGQTRDLLRIVQVSSAGETWHRLKVLSGHPMDAGQQLYVWFLYRSGSSGTCRILIDEAATAATNLQGPAGNLSIISGPSATIDQLNQMSLPDGRHLVQFRMTASVDAGSYSIGIGPGSSVPGEAVEVLAGNVNTGAQQVILEPTYTVDADNLTGPVPSGLDAGFSGVVRFRPEEFEGNTLFGMYRNLSGYWFRAYVHAEERVQVQAYTPAGLEVNSPTNSAALSGEINTLAFRYFPNDLAFSLNGDAVRQDSSVQVISGFDHLWLGRFGGLRELSGGIQDFQLSLERFEDADLLRLSSGDV